MPKSKDVHPSYVQSGIAATSLRGAIRGEILPIAVGTSSKTFAVPAAWKGSLVRIHADGGDVYYQISNDATAPAVCDIAARAVEAGSPIALTPSVSGNGCVPIWSGTWLDVPFGTDAQTFALIGSAACVARTHPSET